MQNRIHRTSLTSIALGSILLSSLFAYSAYAMDQARDGEDAPAAIDLLETEVQEQVEYYQAETFEDYFIATLSHAISIGAERTAETMRALELSLENGVSPNICLGHGEPVFMVAARRGNADLIKLFLQYGFDPKIPEQNGYLPLISTARFNAPDITQALIDAGANIDATDEFGATALHHATRSLAYKTVELLLKHNAETAICKHDEQCSKCPICIARAKLKFLTKRDRDQFRNPQKYDDYIKKAETIIRLLGGGPKEI